MDNELIRFISDELLREFGKVNNQAKFRVVWTGNEYEKREAEYEDWLGNTLIRRVFETREVPKYPYVNPPWYMLERYFDRVDPSLKESNHYEPLYLFQHFDSKGNPGPYLHPRYDMAKLAAETSMKKKPVRTYVMDKAEFEEKEARVERDIFEQLSDQTSYLAHQFHHGEAITMNGNNILPTSPNLRSTE